MYVQSRQHLHVREVLELSTAMDEHIDELGYCLHDIGWETSVERVPAIIREIYQSPACVYKADSICTDQ